MGILGRPEFLTEAELSQIGQVLGLAEQSPMVVLQALLRGPTRPPVAMLLSHLSEESAIRACAATESGRVRLDIRCQVERC